jgi:hypothetical protein
MNEYVSLQKIITLFEEYQQSQFGIGLNGFGYGNIIDFGLNLTGGTQTLYPFMFITPINVSYDENITTYTISIIFADRINDDKFNLVDVQSDMSIQAKRFISWIKRGMNQNPNLYDNMEINLPVTGIPFMERFNDYVGGIAIDAEIVVFEDINACDYYDFSVLPSPTPTPTVTMTPTPTPNSYPIIFVSSGATFDDICSNPQPIPTLYSPQPFFTNEQQLYYDSGLTQFIDWRDNNNQFFASTGGTQLYYYGFAPFGLGTYGFTCPSPSPTPTPTVTTTPTVTPTPTSTPTPTCACYEYRLSNNNPSGTGTYNYPTCPNGTIASVTVSAGQQQFVCAISTPNYFSGSLLSVTKIGNCC